MHVGELQIIQWLMHGIQQQMFKTGLPCEISKYAVYVNLYLIEENIASFFSLM